jgi:hypothetical protein
MATHQDATQHSKIFRVSFTDAEMSDSDDHPDTQSSHPDVVLLWEELRYSGKAVAEDRLDKANFRPDVQSQSPNLSRIRFFEAYK